MENNENISKETPEIAQSSVKNNKNIAVIGFCAVLVIMLTAAIYFKMSKTKTEIKNEPDEIGTKLTKTNLDFKEQKPSFNELTLQTQEVKKDDDPFKNSFAAPVFEAKVYKSSSLAIVANTGNSDNSGDNSTRKKPIDFTDSSQYRFDENGNIVAIGDKSADVDNVEGYDAGVFVAKSAKLMNFDPNLLLPKGTFIGCSLDTRLVSSIKGGISCTISENVYSSNGTTLLIEKGSKMTGFFNSGGMKDGLNRIFVVWNEIRTANNITIPISSGATDNLGGSGIEGWVDNHWFERFGSAILLSVIDDAFNFIANGAKRGEENKDYAEQTRENTKNIADTALKKFIDIEPTLYKNQGDLVAVYVNRDIDFSKVYRLKKVR